MCLRSVFEVIKWKRRPINNRKTSITIKNQISFVVYMVFFVIGILLLGIDEFLKLFGLVN